MRMSNLSLFAVRKDGAHVGFLHATDLRFAGENAVARWGRGVYEVKLVRDDDTMHAQPDATTAAHALIAGWKFNKSSMGGKDERHIAAPSGNAITVQDSGRLAERMLFELADDALNSAVYIPSPREEVLDALKKAEATIAGTLNARGYAPGSCTDDWAPEVRAEVAALAQIRSTLARHGGNSHG